MSEFSLNSQRAFEEAEAIGGRVVLPEANELQIDIDSKVELDEFHKRLRRLENNVPNFRQSYLIYPSKSGNPNKFHITIPLQSDVTPWQRIALQACLGSDPIREILSAARLLKGDPYPTLFIEK